MTTTRTDDPHAPPALKGGRIWQIVAAAAVLAGALATVPNRSLWEPDETYYAEVAREMLVDGNWLVPHLFGELYTQKPPLFMWMVAGGRALGLGWTAAGVLPALLAFLAIVAVMPPLARSVGLNPGAGRLAAALLASSPLAAVMALGARMDMVLTALLVVSLACLAALLGVAYRSSPTRAAHLGLWLAIGLGVLTKGPVAIALPLLTALLYCALARPRPPLRPIFAGWGPLLALALVLAWIVPAGIRGGSEYLYQTIVHQSVGRVARSFAHPQPFYFHLLSYPFSGLPWSIAAIAGATHALRRRHRGAALFLTTAAVTVLAFFSLVSGKLVVYLLPLFPPAALLAADVLQKRLPGSRAATAVGAAGLSLLAVAVGLTPRWRPEMAGVGTAPIVACAAIAATALVALALALRREGQRAALATLAAAGLAFPAIALPLLVPAMEPTMSLAREAAAIVAAEPHERGGLSFRAVYGGLALYSGRSFHDLYEVVELKDALRAGRVVAIYERELEWLEEELKPLLADVRRFPFQRRAFYLIRGHAPGASGQP